MQIALRSSFGPLPNGPVPEGSSAAHPECQSAVLCSRLFEASEEDAKGVADLTYSKSTRSPALTFVTLGVSPCEVKASMKVCGVPGPVHVRS